MPKRSLILPHGPQTLKYLLSGLHEKSLPTPIVEYSPFPACYQFARKVERMSHKP